jgi:hypothetical protein
MSAQAVHSSAADILRPIARIRHRDHGALELPNGRKSVSIARGMRIADRFGWR